MWCFFYKRRVYLDTYIDLVNTIVFFFRPVMMQMSSESESAVLIGFIVAIVVVGLAGGVTLSVFICLKYREYKKRQSNTRTLPSRQRSRRRHRHRHRNSIGTHHGGNVVFNISVSATTLISSITLDRYSKRHNTVLYQGYPTL